MKSASRILSALLVLVTAVAVRAQQAAPQITQPINDAERTTLHGNVHPLVARAEDHGLVPDGAQTGRLILTLKRSAAQEAALQQFLSNAHSKSNPGYHHWLTPAQFGNRFGPAQTDIQRVQAWLQSQGFTVEKVSAGRTAIVFSGTAGQIARAFHTSLHAYTVNGDLHHANATDPQIPSALAPVIAGVTRLNDFHPAPQSSSPGRAKYDPASRRLMPQWTVSTSGGPAYGVGPEDFATQYDLTPLYKAGVTGSGQTIGIINDSNIDLDVVGAYRKTFNLDASASNQNLPHIIIDGNDPGITGDALEAYLDVETAGAVAPQATVNLYIAGNTDYIDGLDLAILRAVEDDSASVLSLSFGSCEAQAGAGYLAYINTIWEQAAAQGQTVMVSTGDNGSAGCDNPDTSYLQASSGLQVNGLASTPWNIAVGGTDFYYSDYATGGASAAQYWNSTNDPNLGSLLKRIPEQPWNNTQYGLNIYPPEGITIAAGSGGQSSCAVVNGPMMNQNSLLPDGYCEGLGGYAKPAWQSAPGVPQDGVRDLPDISLFAANGANLSFYTICAEPGDCVATDAATQSLYYTAVGGTSASAPAFAGILALIDQKYGPQGQADTVLYPLAAQVPSIFHDVTLGNNNVPCDQNSPNCTKDATGGGYSLQNWAAGSGYDLASGLGSVDANALFNNWNSVQLASATVSLNATPASITHGASVHLTTNVLASSGTATPTGAVAILADTTLPANVGQLGITLDATGAGAANVSFLPGGTYTLTARYGGDTHFSSSESAPVNITVAPEPSALAISAFEGQTSPYGTPTPLGTTLPYGIVAGIDAQVTNASGAVDGIATGTITVMDNGTAIATLPLNANGATVYSASNWSVGNHSISFSYSGDASYSASTTMNPKTPVAFTVSQGAPYIRLIAASNSLPAGGSFVVQITVSGSGGNSPSGSVTATLGTLTQTVKLAPITAGESVATAIFPNLAAGSYPLSVAYSGDTQWSSANLQGTPVKVAASSLLPSTAAVTSNPADLSSITSGTLITLTATVQGATTAPTGFVYFVTDGATFSSGGSPQIALVPGSGNTSTATVSFPAGDSYPGINQLYVLYFGDSTYNGSTSPVLMFNNNQGDFAFLNDTPTLTIASGATGTANLTLTGSNQFSGNVSLSCKVLGTGSSLPLCNVPANATVGATGQAAVTAQFNTTLPAPSTAHAGNWLLPGGGVTALAGLLFCIWPSRRRRLQLPCAIVAALLLTGSLLGCGGGSHTTQTTPPPAPTLVPPGTYQAVITATNGVITHNVVVNLNVTAASH
jgi:hypothetical protein